MGWPDSTTSMIANPELTSTYEEIFKSTKRSDGSPDSRARWQKYWDTYYMIKAAMRKGEVPREDFLFVKRHDMARNCRRRRPGAWR